LASILVHCPSQTGARNDVFSRKAGEEVRTPDIQLGKLTLYQLSYARENDEIVAVSQGASSFSMRQGQSTGSEGGFKFRE
jgi:hypothetical protein